MCQSWIKEINFDVIFFFFLVHTDCFGVFYTAPGSLFLRPLGCTRDGTLFLSKECKLQSDHTL